MINDNEIYICIVKNDFSKVKVLVLVIVIFKFKFVVCFVGWINVMIGSRVLFWCKVSNVVVIWFRKGSVMLKIYEVLWDEIFVINIILFDDEGLYICEVRGVVFLINVSFRVFIIVRLCSEWWLVGYNVSGFYFVKFDKDLSFFKVFCNMIERGGVGVFVVSYDLEERIVV